MKKSTKTIFLITIIILAFISIMSIIYGVIHVRQSEASAAELTQQYTEAVNNSIDKCKEISSLLDDSTDYDTAIEYYVENINKSDNVTLKAYIASSMVRYATAYFAALNANQQIQTGIDSDHSQYTDAMKDLANLTVTLNSLE